MSYFLIRTNSWAVCPNGYFVQGFYRGSGDWLDSIEEAKCCKPDTFPDRYEHCYNENILSSFDNKGLSKCEQEGYYVAGIYRGGCDRLSCIETLKCCKMIVGEKRYVCAFVLQSSDQYQYLSNCAPTPPLTCYNKLIS